MRVLLIIDAVGGVLTHAEALIAGLRDAEMTVSAAVLGPAPDTATRRRLSRAGVRSLHTLGGRLEWMEDPWADLEAQAEALGAIITAEQPDLIHSTAYFAAARPWPVPVLLAAHSCVRTWWRAVHREPAPAAWARYGEQVRAGLLGADLVVAPTAAFARAIAREYAVAVPEVIHNGGGPAAVVRGPREAFVLAAGRMWDEAKNLSALEAAAPALSAPVLIAGPLAPDDPTPARDGGLADRGFRGGSAHRLGRLSPAGLAAVRRRAAVFAAPARYEPFGLAILEAARDGCALVLGDIPPLRELWDGAARFVDPDDPDALAAALEDLVVDPVRAGRAGAAARARAEGYRAETMVEAYLARYRRLAPVRRTEIAA